MIRKDEILEIIRKKECSLCRKDSMRKDLDIGVLWAHEGVLEVNQHIVGPLNCIKLSLNVHLACIYSLIL